MGKYDDILMLPHHQSETRPHMSLHDRAAQFASFAALTGYDDLVRESARITEQRGILGDAEADELNGILRALTLRLSEHPEIRVRFFVRDAKKEGGAFREYTGRLKIIDEIKRMLIFEDKTTIPMDDIRDILEAAADDERIRE